MALRDQAMDGNDESSVRQFGEFGGADATKSTFPRQIQLMELCLVELSFEERRRDLPLPFAAVPLAHRIVALFLAAAPPRWALATTDRVHSATSQLH